MTPPTWAIRAYEVTTGKKLWKARIPGGGQATPDLSLGQKRSSVSGGGRGWQASYVDTRHQDRGLRVARQVQILTFILPYFREHQEQTMEFKPAGSQPSQKGPELFFTGTVRIDPLHSAPAPSRVSCAYVTFEPGARSAWHTHPLGQILVVTLGCGWAQCDGQTTKEIRAGDVIYCPSGYKQWHGATPTSAMTHIAIGGAVNGVAVVWMEKVTDEEDLAGP